MAGTAREPPHARRDMPTLLVLNPNTTEAVTERLLAAARARAPSGWALRGATARFGASYISDEAAAGVAARAAVDAWQADAEAYPRQPADAVLLGCFGDPGLFALRALVQQRGFALGHGDRRAPARVHGLAEAAMNAAAARHGRFAVVTGGADWVPMLARLSAALGLHGAHVGTVAVAATGGEMAADPDRAHALLAGACDEALQRWPDVAAVLLGGAGLAGLAAPLQPRVARPVLDNVALALEAVFQADASPAPAPC